MQKLKVLYLFIFLGTVTFLLIGAMGSANEDSSVSNEGKIKFSHSLHKDLVDCQTCHSAVKESVSLKDPLFPNHDNCAECHEVDNDEELSLIHISEPTRPY